MTPITTNEWKFVALAGAAVAILTCMPLIFGYVATPPGQVFLFNPSTNFYDYQVYYSQIAQAKSGVIFFTDLYFRNPTHGSF